MTKPERVRSAPGLAWKKRRHGVFEARWQCRHDIVQKGFPVKSVKLWSGTGEPTLDEWNFIVDTCTSLQQEMLVFSRGDLKSDVSTYDGSLGDLMRCYRHDQDSTFRKLRYNSRIYYETLMRLIEKEHGAFMLADIKGRILGRWYETWTKDNKKVAVAHAKMGMLRTLFSYGTTLLEDEHCTRLSGVMSEMRFRAPKARESRLTAEQAIAIRAKAHEMGRKSIALAQAFQFELMLRQKDVIGEWVPVSEPGMSDTTNQGWKWLRGIRWEEIDQNLTLSHVTSKRQKLITVSLKNAPMVVEELALQYPGGLPTNGPIIVSEWNKRPWETVEFRRWWRKVATAAGVPKDVRNMDSRAGGISEATDAGAALEHVRHAATHSDIAMTQRYSRGTEEKIANVQRLRAEHRIKGETK
jgi:hypothetical protein